MEEEKSFRARAGRRSVDRVSEVEDVVEELVGEEGKSIDLRRGGSQRQRTSEREALTLRAIA